MDVFHMWMDGQIGGDKVQRAFKFTLQFSLPILPADLSLVDDIGSKIFTGLRKVNPRLGTLLLTPATILLQLVVLRVYLQRPASDDIQIYHLSRNLDVTERHNLDDHDTNIDAKCGSISRNLSIPEQVLAAGQGVSDTRSALIPPTMFCNIALKLDKNIVLEHDFQPASPLTENGHAYTWHPSTEQGLTGGQSFRAFSHHSGSEPLTTDPHKPVIPVNVVPHSRSTVLGGKRPRMPVIDDSDEHDHSATLVNPDTPELVLRRSKRLKEK